MDVKGLMPELLADLAQLVRIPSVSSPGYPEPRGPILEAYDAVAELLGGIVAVEAAGAHEPPDDLPAIPGAVTLRAVPYSHWGNRGEGAMRVWIPQRTP